MSVYAVGDGAARAPTLAVRRRKRRDAVTAVLFLLPNLTGFLLFTCIPLIASLGLSFFDWPLVSSPTFIGLHNYQHMLTADPAFFQVLGNTLLFVAGYVPANVIISLGIALWLSTLVRGRNLARILFFVPVMTPMVGVALVWVLLYQPRTGVIDWAWQSVLHTQGPDWIGSAQWAIPAIIIVTLWQNVGYNMLVFSAGLQAIPAQYYEAAAIDGATRWARFRHVTLPMLSPSIFFGTVLTIITSLQVFDQPFIVTGGGPGISSTTMVLYLYQNAFSYYHMGYASAIAWVLFLIIMIFTAIQFVLQRKWVFYES
ncbi:MAG TPA: sugar ABC transporter permease [Chloroflexota bacterium]|nr:sugar ABC transporter permease [Chloroflexota bacterium]